MNNNFYVYEWIRLDTNEPFYVGIGQNNRWKEARDSRRNKYFMRVYNKHKNECAVNILHENLTKEYACDLECWYINEYKYVIGYNLTNLADGGEGTSIVGENHNSNRKVICINTGEIYYSLKHAEEKTGIGYSGISQVCLGKQGYAGKDKDNNPIIWMYYDEYIENNYKFKNKYIKKKRKPVKKYEKNKRNTSGHVGVSFRKDRNKWRAYYSINGKYKTLGMYETYEEALNARLKWESIENDQIN